MNTQTKIVRARTANNRTTPVGEHWTLTRILDPNVGRRYGFAISDAGEQGFIPPHVIERYQMTDADIGAGFHAPSQPPLSGDDTAPQITMPVTFDGAAEEIEVQVEAQPDRDMEEEINILIDRMGDLTKLKDTVAGFETYGKKVIGDLNQLKFEVESMINTAVFLHNEITAQEEWLDEHYDVEE